MEDTGSGRGNSILKIIRVKINSVKETCLYVSDLEKSRNFYHNLLGLEEIGFVENRHIFFRAGNSVLLCFIAEATINDTHLPQHFGSGNQHLAFEVSLEEYEKWKENISGLKIPVEHVHEWPRGFQSFYFRDPDGNLLEIIQPGMWD